ncbi:MAG TPA: hypothetical protein VJ851_00655 [Jatrophihabitans sp.]|nr:hypothetical protein [Jatrophihabitans sp.]
MGDLDCFWVHEVQVSPYLGTSGRAGDLWDTAVPVMCWVEDAVKLVRDSNGAEVVSTATLAADLADAAPFTVNAKVLLPSGREARVLTVGRGDSGALGLPDHIEVALT